jgi:hypothetical protein
VRGGFDGRPDMQGYWERYTRPWMMVSALTRKREKDFEIWHQACHEGPSRLAAILRHRVVDETAARRGSSNSRSVCGVTLTPITSDDLHGTAGSQPIT